MPNGMHHEGLSTALECTVWPKGQRPRLCDTKTDLFGPLIREWSVSPIINIEQMHDSLNWKICLPPLQDYIYDDEGSVCNQRHIEIFSHI